MRISGNFRTFPLRVAAARRQFRDCLDKAMIDAMSLGVETGKDVIESTGTDREWTRPWGGRSGTGRGRIDTGEMLDEFRADVDIDRNETRGELGWIRKQEDYYLFQDLGFWHVLSQREIEGMFALREASEEAWNLLRDKCQDCAERFLRTI